MTTTGDSPDVITDDQSREKTVTVHRSSPDRVVFTEAGNTDGWIATDLTVELQQ